jgi:hypothetical protein
MPSVVFGLPTDLQRKAITLPQITLLLLFLWARMSLLMLTLLEDAALLSGLQTLDLGGVHFLITHQPVLLPVLDLLPTATQQDVLQQTVAVLSLNQLLQLVLDQLFLVQTQQTLAAQAVAAQ